MRDIKERLFYTKPEKNTEKAFAQSLVISVFSLVLCMVALCSTTWAWFNASVSADANNIQSAYCDVAVSVTNDDTPVNLENGQTVFAKDKIYEITMTASGNAQTAYCILNINNTPYYTEQIPIQSGDKTMTFMLKFSADTPIEIITRWGTSSQENRKFKHGSYFVDLVATDPATITASQSQPQETTETGALPEAAK